MVSMRYPNGVIPRARHDEIAAARSSAGPRDLLSAATRPGRGSVTDAVRRAVNPPTPDVVGAPIEPCACWDRPVSGTGRRRTIDPPATTSTWHLALSTP